MKTPIRILVGLLCVALIASMPFWLSGPNLLGEVKMELMNDDGEDGEEIDFGRLLFTTACAEDELLVETVDEGGFPSHPEWALPLDFSVPPAPNPDRYTADGYEDDSIRVKVETLTMNGATVHVAHVQIADPSQLRTAIAGSIKSEKTVEVARMARVNNAVIAQNGDLFIQLPEKKKFEYRMTQKIRSATNKLKDVLIIDEAGDFHLFVKSQGLKEFAEELKKRDGKIVNAFMFGPALVIDGQLQTTDTDYAYSPNYRNPRSAIGQTGPLSYVMVIVEGRGESAGVTHQELAQIMYDLGCVQAYNLDGGNTAEMVMTQPDGTVMFHFKGDEVAAVRPQSDIIYFATSVPEELWK